MKNINIRIDDDLHSRFKKKCRLDGLRINQVLPALMRHYSENGLRAKSEVRIEEGNDNG